MIRSFSGSKTGLLALLAGLVFVMGAQSQGVSTLNHDIRPGPGVSSVRWLSEWLPSLAGTPADTPVYIMEGKQAGGTMFLAGGTHSNEIAGIMTAILFVERAQVVKGRLIVIPHANNSASTWNDTLADPSWISLVTRSGTRFFKYGTRLTNPAHQGGPDPQVYLHPASTEKLDGMEIRNLDRAYPGLADGGLTQRLAFAVTTLLKSENVDIAFDLHEAPVGTRLANMIVANPKNLDVAALALLGMEEKGLPMKLEPSSENFRGLSHREWGDSTKAMAFLIETPHPGMMPDMKKPYDVVNDPVSPLWLRVATHVESIMSIIESYNDAVSGESAISIGSMPDQRQLESPGLGSWLN